LRYNLLIARGRWVLHADPSEMRWSLRLRRAKALPSSTGADNVSTHPLGADYLVEGIVMVILSPP
jgi:hypothetical protein